MINKLSGEVILKRSALHINGPLSLGEFLNSNAAKLARKTSMGGADRQFAVQDEIDSLGPVIATLYFDNERLTALQILCLIDENKSWNEWTKESELARKKLHDQWIAGCLGTAPYRFAWGEVSSEYDARSGSSQIVIRYVAPA